MNKKIIIVYMFFCGVNLGFSQQKITLTICNHETEFDIDDNQSRTSYTFLNNKKKVQPIRFNFINIPNDTITTTDEYGNLTQKIENNSEFECYQAYTINNIDELNLSLTIDGRLIDSLNFAFIMLSTEKRISHSTTPKMNLVDIKTYMNQIIGSISSPRLIIYGITFYEKGNIYVFNGEKIAILINE